MWQVTSLDLTGQLYLAFITFFLSWLMQDHRPLSGHDVLQGRLVTAASLTLYSNHTSALTPDYYYFEFLISDLL